MQPIIAALALAWVVSPAAAQGLSKGLSACRADIDRFCAGIKPGEGRVGACLRGREAELSQECRRWASHGGPGHMASSLAEIDRALVKAVPKPEWVTAEELGALKGTAAVVDVRTPEEFSGGRIPGSVNLPLDRLEREAASLPRDRPLVVVCARGVRAQKAARRLRALGFGDVRVLKGGLSAYPPGELQKP